MTALEQLALNLLERLDADADEAAIKALVDVEAAALDADTRGTLVERINALRVIPALLNEVGEAFVDAAGRLAGAQTLYRYAERVRAGEDMTRILDSELSNRLTSLYEAENALVRARRTITALDRLLQPELKRLRTQELAEEILAERDSA